MALSSPSNRRKRRLIIERGFQYRLTLKICLVASAVFIAFGGAALFLIKMSYEMLIQNALLAMPEMVEQLQREFRLVTLGIVSAFILMNGVIFGLGLFLTQKIAGPLYAFRRQLKEVADGKLSIRLSLRTGDEFVGLADLFNHAMESLEQRHQKQQEEIKSALSALKSDNPRLATDALQRLVVK